MADNGINLETLAPYPGTGPVPDTALFFAKNPLTGLGHRVPSRRMPGGLNGNDLFGTLKIVRTLEDRALLKPYAMCLETECVIIDPDPGMPHRYRLQYSADPDALTVWLDGFSYGGALSTGQWVAVADGSGGGPTTAFVANPAFGRYATGQTVPAAPSAFAAVLDAFSAEIFPAYTAPTASLSSSAQGPFEAGFNFAATLSTAFAQNDAGALTGYELKRGATVLATTSGAHPDYAETVVLPLGATVWTAKFDYAQGAQKTGSAGNPAPGRIGAGSVSATFVAITYFKGFFGEVSSKAAKTVAELEALGNGILQVGPARTLTATAGPGKYFCYAWPSTGSDDVTSILQNGATPVRLAFGAVRYVTGANALGAVGTWAYIISDDPNAFTGANLAIA